MKVRRFIWTAVVIILLFGAVGAGVAIAFPRRYRRAVESENLNCNLIYAIIKAESGFQEKAVSRVGAVGLMQILPATAKFVCEREEMIYNKDKLFEAEYNIRIGCLYLTYLLEKFPVTETAIAAYNAGEGTVREWLNQAEFSDDGKTLKDIPYPETRGYVEKIKKFWKIYEFLY